MHRVLASHPRWLHIAVFALKALVGAAALAVVAQAARAEGVVVFDDFEATIPVSIDPNGILTGYVTFDDGPSSVAFSITNAHPALPGADQDNQVLRLDVDVTDWAVFANFFAFEDDSGGYWMPYDWRAFDGISFWLHGQDSGVELFVDIIENRNRDTITEDAERFVYTFKDDFAGWKRISIPFDDFVRKDIGNGAPDDGFGRERVHGWAIGSMFTDGPRTFYIDDLSLQRSRTDESDPGARAPTDYPIEALPMYGQREKTPAQESASDTFIRTMTQDGRSREAAAQAVARDAWDFHDRGEYAASIRRFNEAWLLDPGNQLALWGFAATSVERGNHDEAARYYRMAIEAGPQDARLEREYRLTLRQLEKLGQAPVNGA